MQLHEMGKKARQTSSVVGCLSAEKKRHLLEALALNLLKSSSTILEANQRDLDEAKAAGMEAAMLDRLSVQGRLEGIAQDLQHVAQLPDPIGKELESRTLPNGLSLTKRRVPIGVLGVIYESRPNVTIDVAALALKTGNCAILRGGSEALHTNRAFIAVVRQTLEEVQLPADAIQFIDSPDRALVTELLKLHEYVDLIIPRGGSALHTFCRENSHIPVITGGIGICHLFVDSKVDEAKALEVIYNAKTQRPTVCNALDTLIVDKTIAHHFIPKVLEKLGQSNVSFRLDPTAMKIVSPSPSICQPAQEEDWNTEWLSLVLGIRVVENLDEAIDHIRRHSTGHSDGILTENPAHATRFVNEVDSACVYVNASTRFTDGGQFGLGAEVAISTQKLHARGPMGPDELTTYKWIVRGNYQTRS